MRNSRLLPFLCLLSSSLLLWVNAVNAADQEVSDTIRDHIERHQMSGSLVAFGNLSGNTGDEMLRSKSSGVAEKSQHLVGNAIDVRLRGLDTKVLRDYAKNLNLGGVCYYASSNFVHVDTGRVRYW
jgi:uncharacterized protein YcbK (DUF882 family)